MPRILTFVYSTREEKTVTLSWPLSIFHPRIGGEYAQAATALAKHLSLFKYEPKKVVPCHFHCINELHCFPKTMDLRKLSELFINDEIRIETLDDLPTDFEKKLVNYIKNEGDRRKFYLHGKELLVVMMIVLELAEVYKELKWIYGRMEEFDQHIFRNYTDSRAVISLTRTYRTNNIVFTCWNPTLKMFKCPNWRKHENKLTSDETPWQSQIEYKRTDRDQKWRGKERREQENKEWISKRKGAKDRGNREQQKDALLATNNVMENQSAFCSLIKDLRQEINELKDIVHDFTNNTY